MLWGKRRGLKTKKREMRRKSTPGVQQEPLEENLQSLGRLGGSVVGRLPSAQVMIPESWDRAPRRAPCSVGSLLLPLPAAPPACALSLSEKEIKTKKINK